ncbi:MAG: WS/DGAT domain-containing protein, partial [Polaromonas sp.]
LLAPWLVGGAAKLALNAYGKSGMASRLPMVANLAISNVPGPPVPLYLAGARILTFHPLSIVLHGLALNITIQSYAGQVDFGIVADKKALPHAKDLAKAIEAAFGQAQALMAGTASAAPQNTAKQASATPVKTRKAAVSKVTKAAKLEKPPSVERKKRPDTVSAATTTNPTKTSNASSHGKSVTQAAPAKPVSARSAPRKSNARQAAPARRSAA